MLSSYFHQVDFWFSKLIHIACHNLFISLYNFELVEAFELISIIPNIKRQNIKHRGNNVRLVLLY